MKFTDEQKDLLAFLPKALKNSKELTDSSKLVLGNIIFLYGMEDAQKNGYVYRTNPKMMEETGIKSEHTLIGAVRLLELLGYIETKRGKRKEASTYKLLINCSKTPQNCSNNCSEIETLQNQVLLLQKQMVLLQKEVENLKNCSNNCSTDTDKDIEIEKDIYTTCGNDTCMEEDNIKEKTYIKEMEHKDNGTMGISPSDERDESFWEFYNSLEDGDDWDESQTEGVNRKTKENEMNDNGMNGMNANGNEEKRNDTTTSTYGYANTGGKGNNPSREKVNISTYEDKNNTSTESLEKITATAAQSETEKKRASLLKNIEEGKKFMYEASNMKDLNGWKMQMEYITMQFNNLKKITSPEAYKSVRTDFKRWWDATKQFFPTDYKKHIAKKEQKQHPKRNLEKNIKPIDVRILQYWIDERENANAQEQKDNAQNMIDTVLSGWYDKYETDAIVQVCQECHLNGSGGQETAKVEQLPTEHKTTQYKPREEEYGDFLNDSPKIYYINTPSAQVAN